MASLAEYIVNTIKTQVESLKPVSLDEECGKVTNMIKEFLLNDNLEVIKNSIMSPDVISNAKGLIFLTVGKIGVNFTVRGGSGIILARLPDGTWSAPSAVKIGGFGLGGQFGAEILEIVMVLSTEEAVKNFFEMENIIFGGSVSVAIGGLGRVVEMSAIIRNISTVIMTYGRSKGAFVGASGEGSVLQQNNESNNLVYGEEVTVKDILNGTVPKPEFANELYAVLHKCEEAGRAAAAAAAAANQKRNANARVPHEKQPLIQPVVTQVNRDEKKPF